MKSKKGIAILAIGLVAVVAAGSYYFKSKSSTPAVETAEVNEFQVAEVPLSETYTTTGTIIPENDEMVIVPFDARIAQCYIEIGQKVSKGDLMYELEASDVEYNIKSMEYDIDVLKSTIASTNITGSMTKESAVKTAEKSLETATTDLTDAKELFSTGALAQTELTSYEKAYETAVDNLEDAKKDLSAYEAENNITLSKKKLELMETSLANLKADLEDTRITAPFDGVVTNLYLKTGDYVEENDTLCQITDLVDLNVEASISEYDLQKLAAGMTAQISTLSDKTDKYNAEIKQIGYIGASDGSEVSLPVELKLSNEKDLSKLLPNFTVTVEILTSSSEHAKVVPFEAVGKNASGNSIVLKKTASGTEAVEVETGITNEIYMEVISDDISVGDTIVYSSEVSSNSEFQGGFLPMGGTGGGGGQPPRDMQSGNGGQRRNNSN